MTSVAPPVPHPAPEGWRWIRSVAAGVQLLPGGEYRKCSVYRGPVSTRRSACNANAVALKDGQLRCAEHLRRDGIWIEMGVAWAWSLAKEGE